MLTRFFLVLLENVNWHFSCEDVSHCSYHTNETNNASSIKEYNFKNKCVSLPFIEMVVFKIEEILSSVHSDIFKRILNSELSAKKL